METDSVEVSDDNPTTSMEVEDTPVEEIIPVEESLSLPIGTAEDDRFDRSLSMDVVPSAAHTSPEGSPVGSPTAGGDVSRAGRKRKANTKYMDEPSPVIKPVVRKFSTSRKSAPPPPPPPPPAPSKKGGDKKAGSLKEEEPLVVTGPPTFGSLLFGGKSSRKLSESLSDLDLGEEEEIPEIVSEDDLIPEPPKKTREVKSEKTDNGEEAKETPTPSVALMIGMGEKMPGSYIASGAVGPTVYGLITVPLVPPSDECSIKFPDISSDEFQASLPERVAVMAELSGGGVLSLIPNAPISWFRDEVPKLSAYFRKKMEAAGGVIPPKSAQPVEKETAAEKRAAVLTAAQREERRRQKEEERRRLIEERNRRRERERLKQLYRQHWLALTKFPIEDDLLHSHKGIRRLGHPPPQARQVAKPLIFWDCRLGPPGTLEIPTNVGSNVTELVDELFVVWNFFIHFSPLVGGPRFTLPQLVEAVVSRNLTPLMEDIYNRLLKVLQPWVEWQITTYLQAEQGLESQLTKNRGRAKMHWSSICQFRDLLFLGYSTLIVNPGASGDDNWLWRALLVAKAGVLLESIDYKSKDFLTTISTAFEEIDFEHKWIFDWELNRSWTFEQLPFEYRVRLLKLLIDRIISLPVVKKTVDLWCEARTHISAEISAIEKEERKLSQRITLCQKLQAIVSQAPNEATGIQMPMTEEELVQESALRDSFVRSRKTASVFFDNELAVRLEIMGRDRHMNEYFLISSDRRFVFVRQRSVSHHNVIRYGIYDSLANFEQLIQSLDDRGVRELSLKTELQKIRTNLYQDAVGAGKTKFDQLTIDWLGLEIHAVSVDGEKSLEQLDEDARKFSQVKFLRDCVEKTISSFERIQKAWNGNELATDDDDDVTVDEGTLDEEMNDDASESSVLAIAKKPFVPEIDRFHNCVETLAQTITECIKNSLIGSARPDETTATTSSILIQFHIKTGVDLLRHVSIPVEKTEFNKLIISVDPMSSKSMIQAAAVFLDGLEALDEIVHAEIARHEASHTSIEIWPATGGEKHAWKQFISARTDSGRGQETSSPAGEGEDEQQPQQEEAEEDQRGGNFECGNCSKKFKFHILLGLHKLHPCKTRGRKPLPVDPVMEVLPLATSNGVLAIERVGNVDFPPLPSSRQEAAERAEKAERAAAAAAASATESENPEAVGATGIPTATTEFICEICGKVFPHNQGLAVHQTRWCIPEQQAQLLLTAQQAVGGVPPPAMDEGPVNCPTCGKTFPTAQGLSIHQTRWCKGPENGEPIRTETQAVETSSFDAIKSIHVNPVFREDPVSADDLVRIDEKVTPETSADGEPTREPGFTPACYSLAAMSVAVNWYACKLDTALKKYNSDRTHHSRSAKSRK
jgi:hypothetical protein